MTYLFFLMIQYYSFYTDILKKLTKNWHFKGSLRVTSKVVVFLADTVA